MDKPGDGQNHTDETTGRALEFLKTMSAANWKNNGRNFEAALEKVLTEYRSKGLMNLRKVDPPTTVVRGKIIMKRNPFLDFVGCWDEQRGRAIFMEAKTTLEPSLAFGDRGLKDHQIDSLRSWTSHRAAAFVLWEMKGQVRLVHIGHINSILKTGRKHIKWHEADEVKQGLGMAIWDFRQNMLKLFPATPTMGI